MIVFCKDCNGSGEAQRRSIHIDYDYCQACSGSGMIGERKYSTLSNESKKHGLETYKVEIPGAYKDLCVDCRCSIRKSWLIDQCWGCNKYRFTDKDIYKLIDDIQSSDGNIDAIGDLVLYMRSQSDKEHARQKRSDIAWGPGTSQ